MFVHWNTAYHKLLFITDPAVIPFPDLDQKIAMADYAIEMANRFGVDKPKIALISATEKMGHHFESSVDYSIMCKMADRNQIGKLHYGWSARYFPSMR